MPAAKTICEELSAELRLRTSIHALISAQVAVPETFGVRAPVILLPEAANQWTPDRLRIVLLHELMHVKRGDWAVHLLARIVASLFWCNPLTWYALARLQDERERACDDDVLRFGVTQSEYAEQLVEIARSARIQFPAIAVAMARPAHLEGRVRAILNPKTNRRSLTLTSKAITAFPALLVIATVSLVTAPAQTGNAQISGIVKDPSGARVPGVQVLLAKGSAVETVRTNATGGFEFSGVPDGTYTLKVMAPGFKLLEISDVVAKAFSPAFVNLTLDVGAINERITITAQGQARQQPPIASTALQQEAAKPRAISFANVVGEAPAPATGPQRIRVGGNIRPSRLITSPRPQYPAHLAAQGVEGTVILAAIIGTNWHVLNVKPKNSQVNAELIQAAVDAVRQWQYEPTLLNGQPVEVITTVTIEFALKP
jgi:TonB family protein